VIPAGETKTRSNDTDYPYRPHTAFVYLTGWGADTVPGSILLGIPQDTGHHWVLFTRPPAPRTSDEFYANPAIGEFWTGRRPGLADVATWLGLETRDRADWSDEMPLLSNSALIRDSDSALTEMIDSLRHSDDQTGDDTLARVISEMRLVKDDWEIGELTAAVEATQRGFDRIITSLPEASAHPRGERIIEGVFQQAARLEGNDTGYGTIAASGVYLDLGIARYLDISITRSASTATGLDGLVSQVKNPVCDIAAVSTSPKETWGIRLITSNAAGTRNYHLTNMVGSATQTHAGAHGSYGIQIQSGRTTDTIHVYDSQGYSSSIATSGDTTGIYIIPLGYVYAYDCHGYAISTANGSDVYGIYID
jgi:hypothetical protein